MVGIGKCKVSDGLDDLIVSAYQADLSDKTEAGKSYVIFGKQII